MRNIPNDFATYHYDTSKEPVHVVEIAFDAAATDLVYLTSHDNTPLPIGAESIQGAIKKITGTTQKIQPDKGRSTIGNISISALDTDSAITNVLKNRDDAGAGIRHKRVRVYMGFAGMTWQQIESNLIQTQIVDDLKYFEGVYTFQCADILRSTRKKIFDVIKTRLSQSIDDSQLLIPVYSVTDFNLIEHGSSYTDAPNQSVGYIKVEDEVIRYTGTVTDPTLGLCFVADLRGALNTKAEAHTVEANDTNDRGTDATEFIYLELPAVKLIYALLTGELYGQPGQTLPDNWHLGIDPQFVRQSDFTGIGPDLWDTTNDNGFIVRFSGEKNQDGKKFLESQICLLLGAYMPVYSTGELGLRRFTNVLHQSPWQFELNENNVTSFGQLEYDMQSVHNLLSIEWNYDFVRKKLTRQKIISDSISRSKYDTAPEKAFKFRGLHGSRHTSTTIEGLFDRLRDRYAAPPQLLTVKCLPYLNMLEVGDIVKVKLQGVKDYFSGGTQNRAMEVQQVSVDWVTGDVTLKLFGSSLAAEPITPTDPEVPSVDPSTKILPDNWYTSAGTDLSTYPGVIFYLVGQVGHISAGTIIGGSTLSVGRFFYNGDLEIDAGAEIFIDQNVLLCVSGHLQVNGKINGVGRGQAGAAALTLDAPPPPYTATNPAYQNDAHALGLPGYLGPTLSAGRMTINNSTIASQPGYQTHAEATTVPALALEYTDGTLNGLPVALWGSSGATGGVDSRLSSFDTWIDIAGGAGGASGAGLAIVSRGLSFGIAGEIDVSGTDGATGLESHVVLTEPVSVSFSGSGAGGAPGAVVFCIDGLNNPIPGLQHITAKYGASPYPTPRGTIGGNSAYIYPMPEPSVSRNALPNNLPVAYSHYVGYSDSPPDLGGFNGASRVIYIPPLSQAEQDRLEQEQAVNWEDIEDPTGTKPEDNATQNQSYNQESSPLNPAENARWYQPSTKLEREYTSGSWQIIANSFDGTSDLLDDANLGQTATWQSVADRPPDSNLLNNRTEQNVTTIPRPQIGTLSIAAPNQTGAIKITLPQSWTNTMLRFFVDIFDYTTSKSSTIEIAGYNFAGSGGLWVNTTARSLGNSSTNYVVRFCHDDINCCVVIGEINSNWNYPKVTIRDFQAGHSQFEIANWNDGWSISLITTLPVNIDRTITDILGGAIWDEVVGGGKPEDNATVGATAQQANDIINALNIANNAQAIADGKIVTFINEVEPVADGVGDFWLQPSTKILRIWNGTVWELASDATDYNDERIANTAINITSANIADFVSPQAIGTNELSYGAVSFLKSEKRIAVELFFDTHYATSGTYHVNFSRDVLSISVDLADADPAVSVLILPTIMMWAEANAMTPGSNFDFSTRIRRTTQGTASTALVYSESINQTLLSTQTTIDIPLSQAIDNPGQGIHTYTLSYEFFGSAPAFNDRFDMVTWVGDRNTLTVLGGKR